VSYVTTEPQSGLMLEAAKRAGLWRVGGKKSGGRGIRRAAAKGRRREAAASTSTSRRSTPTNRGGFGHGL
jgi:hypothetical protein